MFRRFFVIAAAAVCLVAAAWLFLGFTQEQSAPRVGNFISDEASVSEMKIVPPKISFPPYPHGKPLQKFDAGRNYFVFFNTSS